jgi:hypothetical protein
MIGTLGTGQYAKVDTQDLSCAE